MLGHCSENDPDISSPIELSVLLKFSAEYLELVKGLEPQTCCHLPLSADFPYTY